jgi:hypothetical protein
VYAWNAVYCGTHQVHASSCIAWTSCHMHDYKGHTITTASLALQGFLDVDERHRALRMDTC